MFLLNLILVLLFLNPTKVFLGSTSEKCSPSKKRREERKERRHTPPYYHNKEEARVLGCPFHFPQLLYKSFRGILPMPMTGLTATPSDGNPPF